MIFLPKRVRFRTCTSFTVRWRYCYPKEPGFPYGLNMYVMDDGSTVVCGYSWDNDVYDMFLLILEDEGAGISETGESETGKWIKE